jgi:phospholipase C
MPIPPTSINSTPRSASIRTGLEQSVWVEFERDSTDSTLPSWTVMIAYESQRPKWGDTCELGVASPKQGMATLILPMSTASPRSPMSAVSSLLW